MSDDYVHPMEADDGGFEFSEKSIRRGFIRKVYAVLACQLLITFGIVSIFVFVQEVNEYSRQNVWLFWVAFALSIFMILFLGCFGNLRRKVPWNFIALLAFTLCEGYLLGCVAATYDADEVLIALAITIVVAVGLTLFAFQTKIDFTLMSGILYVFFLVLFTFGIFALIFQSQVLRILYASLGALLFAVYLVFDTQLIIGGKHKVTISPEEYIFASLNLYLDVVNLFLFILALVGGGRN